MSHETEFRIQTIGYVRRADDSIHVKILQPYRPALRPLGRFSHAMVFWWADRHDNEKSRRLLQTRPPYAGDEIVGVFATRAEYRSNPIAMTACEMLGVDEEEEMVRLVNLDAYDGTPVLDLKAYVPVCDRVKQSRVPYWAEDWPERMPDEGIGL